FQRRKIVWFLHSKLAQWPFAPPTRPHSQPLAGARDESSLCHSALSAPGGFLLLLFALLAQHGFARQANFVALDGEYLDEDLIAQLQRIAYVAQTLLGDFADMQQAVGARENFHEGTEFREPH